jgi:hypothetical protein
MARTYITRVNAHQGKKRNGAGGGAMGRSRRGAMANVRGWGRLRLKPIVKVGLIELGPSPFSPGKLWIQHAGGEGMDVSVSKLERLLCRFFWKEF